MNKIYLALYNFFFIFLPVSVGNHTNYGGGGGGDTGGGGGATYTHDYSASHSYHSGAGTSSDNLSPLECIAALIVFAFIAIVYFRIKSKFRKSSDARAKSVNNVSNSVGVENLDKIESIVNNIKLHDKNFSRDDFLSWAEKVFVKLQEAWEERDWKKARPFESEALFNTHKAQLDDYIKNGRINIMDNVCVNESFICDYYMDAGKEYLTVFMKTRYHDYIIAEDTKKVIEGNPNTTYLVKYKAKFVRTVGVQTGMFSNKSTTICPNCGAPVDVNAAGQCAYCGTVITDTTHDWVLCDLDDCGQSEI